MVSNSTWDTTKPFSCGMYISSTVQKTIAYMPFDGNDNTNGKWTGWHASTKIEYLEIEIEKPLNLEGVFVALTDNQAWSSDVSSVAVWVYEDGEWTKITKSTTIPARSQAYLPVTKKTIGRKFRLSA